MKMLSLRFNVRLVLIALVVVALMVVLEIGRRRRMVFLEKANEYAVSEESYVTAIKLLENAKPARKPDLSKVDTKKQGPVTEFIDEAPDKLADDQKAQLASFREKAAVQKRLKEKYQQAANFPWATVVRDPAEPPIPEGPPEPVWGAPGSERGASKKGGATKAAPKKAASKAEPKPEPKPDEEK